MKIAGIIGGIGPESTLDYYRLLTSRYADRNDGRAPRIIINSIELDVVVDFVTRGVLDEMARYLSAEIKRLAEAGATFAALAANTPHVAFDKIRSATTIPLISIIEATGAAVANAGAKRAGVFGTRFTMQSGMYNRELEKRGITCILPTAAEQEFIHERYMGELVKGTFLDSTRDALLEIVNRLQRDEHVDSVILGGTELPLLLRQPSHQGIAFFDTTRIHVDRIIDELMA